MLFFAPQQQDSATVGQRKTLFDLQVDQKAQRSHNVQELLKFAHKNANKRPLALVREWFPLARGPGKLTFPDYVLYQLYGDRYTAREKERFISDKLHWPITRKCCDMSWFAITEDKWICYELLEKFGVRTPKTLAVVDRSQRAFGATPKITSPAELEDFLHSTDQLPIFGKPNRGIGSFGCFRITGVDDSRILLDQGDPETAESLFEKVFGSRTYLLQNCVENHPVLRPFTEYLATVRTVNFVNGDSISTPFTVLKLPSANTIADNFWRRGNFLADIDPERGTVRRAIHGRGVESKEFEVHPITKDRFIDFQLPYWKELRRLNDECARLFEPLKYHSLDIALTSEGPLVIEVNTGGSFELPQLARGEGMLTDDVRDFFSASGWKFA